MAFKGGDLHVIKPLDPTEGRTYVELDKEDYKELENIYQMTTIKEDYINPTIDGTLSWRSVSADASDSNEGFEN